jgi:hypothetical protein
MQARKVNITIDWDPREFTRALADCLMIYNPDILPDITVLFN